MAAAAGAAAAQRNSGRSVTRSAPSRFLAFVRSFMRPFGAITFEELTDETTATARAPLRWANRTADGSVDRFEGNLGRQCRARVCVRA